MRKFIGWLWDVGIDEFNSKYICWYPKLTNIGYIY
jgi:hypothetical protein